MSGSDAFFDIDGARADNYSDAEIADYLGNLRDFDVEGARADGYTDDELIHHLFRPQQRSEPAPTQEELERASRPARMVLKDAKRPVLAPASFPEDAAPAPIDTSRPMLVEGYSYPNAQAAERAARDRGRELYQRGGRYYTRPAAPPPMPAVAGAELTDAEAVQPARMLLTRGGQPYRTDTPKPFDKTGLPADWQQQMGEYELAMDERPKPPWYDWAKRNAGMLEPSQFEKGVTAGGVGAKQMGVAAATIPIIGAMKTLAAELNAYDRIDRENQYAVPKGEGMSYVAGKARMYLSSPPETRARLRQQALERFAAHGETKDQLVQAWRAYAQEMQQHKGKTVNFTDVNDVSSFSDWFAWNFGQGLPYMSAAALSAVLGGALGGPAGAGLGLGAAGYAMGIGDIQGEGIEKGIEDKTAGAALVGGVPYAALEFLGPVGRAFRMVSRGTLDNVAKSYLRRAGKEVTANAIQEFINEAGQEIVKDASVMSATGEPLVTDESLLRWFNSGMAGAAGGGPFGAASAIPGPAVQPRVTSGDAAQPGVTPAAAPPPPAAPPPGAEPDGRVEPTLSRADLDRVVGEQRPAREIVAEEDREAARARVEPAAQAVQREEETRAARVDELGLPQPGERMTVSAPTGPVTGVVESSRPTETGWELRLRDDDGEVHVFNESDRVQISTPARRGDGTKDDPVRVTASAQIGEARARVDPNPTPAQKRAENYEMGHIRFDEGHPYHGLPEISIETAKGGTRTAKDGSWSVPNFPADYGRFKGTEGMDGDHVDVMVGDGGKIFVIDQINAETGAADEHKVMLGYPTPKAARDTYIAAFSDGKGAERIGALTPIGVQELKAWLGDRAATKRPVGEISTPEEWMEDLEWDDEHRLAGYLEDLEHDIARASEPGWRPAMREAARRIQARIRQLQLGETDATRIRTDAGQVHEGRPSGERGEEQGRPAVQRESQARPGAGNEQPPRTEHGEPQRARDGGQPAQPDSRALTPQERERARRQWAKFTRQTRRGGALGLRSRNRFAVDERGRFRELGVDEEPGKGEQVAEGQDALNALRSKRLRAYLTEMRRPDTSKDSLNEWIAKTGGMALGERLDTIGDDKNQVFNVSQWLFTKRGRPADELARAAHTAGYLTNAEYEDVDGGVQALRDKIADEFGGRRKHHAFGAEAETGRQRGDRFEDELYARAKQLGIPTEGLSAEEVDRLVARAEAIEAAIAETENDREARLEREAIQAENLTPLEEDDGAIGLEPAEPGAGARQAAPARGQPAAPRQPLGEDAAEVGEAPDAPAEPDRRPDEDEDLEPQASRGGRTLRSREFSLTSVVAALDNIIPRYEAIGARGIARMLRALHHEYRVLLDRPAIAFYDPPTPLEEPLLAALEKNERLHREGKFLESPFDDDPKGLWPEKWFNQLRDSHGDGWVAKAREGIAEMDRERLARPRPAGTEIVFSRNRVEAFRAALDRIERGATEDDVAQASQGARLRVLAPREGLPENTKATTWQELQWWEGQDYYAANIDELRVLILRGTAPDPGEGGAMPPYRVLVAGTYMHLPNQGAAQTLEEAKQLAFAGARLERPVYMAKNEGKRRPVPGRWVDAPPPEGDITWSKVHGESATASIAGKPFAYITRAPGAKTVTLRVDGWVFEIDGKEVDAKEIRDVTIAKQHVERILGAEPEEAAGQEVDHALPDELEDEDLTDVELRELRGEEGFAGEEPMASQGGRRGRASLAERVEALEKRVDRAYERDDPNAEDLDAELAELREQLTSAFEQRQGELEPEDFDYSTVEEELRQAYVHWLRGGGTYGDQANARDAMRGIVEHAGGRATEDQAFEAAADAYSAAVARRVRRMVVHGGTVYQVTEDGPVLVARDVAVVQPSKWESRGDIIMYEHTILDVRSSKDIGRITLGWRGDQVALLPDVRLWSAERRQGRGEAVLRAVLEHNGEGVELNIPYIANDAKPFWRKMGVDVLETAEGDYGTVTLEAYRAARPGGARAAAQPGAAAEARQPQDARAGEAPALETPGLSQSRVVELLVEALGPGVHALIDSGFLNLARTPAQLPEHLASRTGARTEAWYDPAGNDGKGAVWLIVSQLDADRVVPVFLHEVGEHHGLRRILGLQGYRQLQETVRNLAERNPVVQAAWAHVAANYPGLRPGGAQFVSEVIARVGETEEGMRLPFIRRLINAVREFLIRLGLKAGLVSEISDRDIVLLIQAAARRVVEEAEEAAAQAEPREYPAQASIGDFVGGIFGKDEGATAPIKAQPGVSFRRLNQLLGAKLYGEPKDIAAVSVKEMVQNAFDAIKTLIDRGELAKGEIDIKVDAGARSITVRDNGSGMTPQTLATTFLQVAGTQKESERSSGGLGIAKGLFLYGNERIRVETVRNGKIAVLDTSGEELSAAADGTGQAPEIQVKSAMPWSKPGTEVTVLLPKSYVDASTGKTLDIVIPTTRTSYPVLDRSPLFSNIEVKFNGRTMANIGSTFASQDYSVFARVKFQWGDATVYVSKNRTTGESSWEPNVHYLSNGLWQFSTMLNKDPFGAWGDKIDRRIYVDIHPKVSPEDSAYPFDLNRQRFTPQTMSDFTALLAYVSLAYRREQISDQADNFGQVRYLDNGRPGKVETLRPERKPGDEAKLLRIVEGDKVEIEEGRLVVNGREIPMLSREELEKTALDLSQYKIDQSRINPLKVMLHDNAQLQTKGVMFSDFARAELGAPFDRFVEDLGRAFISLRNAFALNYPGKYKGLNEYAIGVSFDKAYHGVHILAPFKGVFVNPAGLTDMNEVVAGNELFGTMVHELVHFKEMNHGPAFVNELQRMYSEVLADPILDAIRRNLVDLVSDNAEVLRFITEAFRNENIAAVGKSFEGRGQERAQGPDEGRAAPVDRGAAGEDGRGARATRGGAVDRQLPGPGEEEGPLASQGGASNIPALDPEKFELTAKQTIEAEPPNREPGDRHWIGDISLFTKLAIHPRMMAALEASFVPVYRVGEAQIEDRDQIAHALASRIEPYFRLPEESKTKINAVLELDRLDEKVHLAGKEMAAKNEGHRLARLSKPGETIALTDVEKTAYWAVRRMLDVALKMFRDQLLAELGVDASKFKGGDIAAQILDTINPRMTEEEKANYEKAAAFAHEIEQARRRGYVPFTRWGNVVIAVKNKKGTVLWAEKVEVDPVEFHKRGAAMRLGRELRQMPSVARALANVKKLFPDVPNDRMPVFQIPEGAEAAASHPDIGQLDQLARVAGLEPAEWDGVRAKLEAALKARGFRKHFLGSTNVAGYSGDFERAVADYVTGMAGYLARRKHREAWDQAIAGIPAVKRRLRDYAHKYHEYMQSPQEELHLLRQIGFIYYLGMIPASAIANLTQIPLVSAPYLAQFANPAIVAKELTAAVADVALMYRPIDSGFEMFDPAAAPEDVREALQEAWARGFFMPLQTFEVQAVAYGRTPYGRKAKRALRDTRDGIAYLFSLAERTNRITTFIAAYRLARRRGFQDRVAEVLGKNPLARAELGIDQWRAVAEGLERRPSISPERFGTWVVDETQFRMGKVNRPQIGRGPGAAILQFKGFQMQLLELYWRMMSQNGIHGKTAAATSMLLFMLVAGFWGLPGAEDLRDLWEKIYSQFNHVGVDVKARMREWVYELTGSAKLAEMFSRGVPAGAGFDLSGRVGMGNIAPDTPVQVLGIPADITKGRMDRMIEHFANDSPELAWAEALPNFLRNYVTAASWLGQGVRNRRGDVVIPKEQVGVSDAILRGFVGVTPTWISNRRDLVYAQARVESAINEKKDDFYEKAAKARADLIRAERANDPSAAGAAAKRIREQRAELARYNEGRPLEERIVLNDNALEQRVLRELKGAEARRGKGRLAARPRRERLREVYGVE